jgi:hypothetical protein
MKPALLASLWLTIGNFFFMSCAYSDSAGAIRQPGVVVSTPNGACTASLKTSSQGGFLQLYIGHDQDHLAHVADDVTGIAWATSTSLVFSVSPVYGSPGIFLVTCSDNLNIKMLVGPNNIDKAYPQGADYFELRSIIGHEIQFYYGDDVDKINFSQWRSSKNMRIVRLPKSG